MITDNEDRWGREKVRSLYPDYLRNLREQIHDQLSLKLTKAETEVIAKLYHHLQSLCDLIHDFDRSHTVHGEPTSPREDIVLPLRIDQGPLL